MRPHNTPAGWRPSRHRIDAAIWRWVIFPLITAAILIVAAYFATFAARADDWICTGTNICFDRAGIFYSNTEPGQMIVRATDFKSGESGWIAVDCVARLATAGSPVFAIEHGSPLDNLCDTIGSAE